MSQDGWKWKIELNQALNSSRLGEQNVTQNNQDFEIEMGIEAGGKCQSK